MDTPAGAGPPALAAALELLTVLAEEASGYHPSLTPARRRAWAAEAGSAAPAALAVLARCVGGSGGGGGGGGSDPVVRAGALTAYAAWVRLASSGVVGGSGPLPGMDGATLAAHPLTAAALAGLADPAAFDAAVDAVAELVYVSAAGGRPAPGMEPLAAAIVPAVLGLRPRFAAAAARARGGGSGAEPSTPSSSSAAFEDDDDTARGMARLFAEVGEAYVGLIAAAATPDAAAPAAALLDVAAHPDDGVAATSFAFWHRLSRALTGGSARHRPSSATGAVADGPPPSPALAAFTPAFEALVTAIAGRVAWPPGHEAWRRDERADFKRARAAVGGTLTDAAAVLGGRRTLELLTAPLASAAAAVAGGAPLDWRTAEAALYCVRAIHRAAPPPGDPLLSGLLASLPSLPPAPLLQYTACLTVGAYADWVAASAAAAGAAGGSGGPAAPDPSAALGPLLALVTRALACPDAAPAAALALRHLCDAAGGLLGPHLRDLAALAGAAAGAGAAARGGGSARPSADGGGGGGPPSSSGGPTPVGSSASLASLEEADVVAIGEAAALAAAAQPDPAARRAALEALLRQAEGGLAAAVHDACGGGDATAALAAARASSASGSAPSSALICAMADRLAAVLAHCGPDPAAATESLGRALPLVEAALATTAGDARAAERLIRVPRYALRSAGPAAAGPALTAVSSALPRWFAGTRCSAALYAASELCKAHGRGAAGATADALAGLLDATLRPALEGLTSTSAFDAAPDVADDAYLLAGRALAYCPALLLVSSVGGAGGGSAPAPADGGLVALLLASAVPGALAQHREACASVLAFLQRVLDPDTLARADADAAALAGGGGGGVASAAAARLPPARDVLAAAVRPIAPALARALLAGVAGGLPAPRVRDVADVLLAMVRAAREAGLAWLGAALALLPDAAAGGADRDRVLAAAGAAAAAGPGGSPGADAAVAQFDEAVEELSELARRSARARNAALSALAPEAVGGRVVLAA